MIIAPPEWLTRAVEPWNTYYSDHGAVRTIIVSLHVVPLLLGGGAAVTMDRLTLDAGRVGDEAGRGRQLATLGAAHRMVTLALALVTLSGLALLLADLETYFGSWVFWTKMALFVGLLVNGIGMLRAERAMAHVLEGDAWDEPAGLGWRRLERAARASLALWTVITVLGVALVNAS